MYFKLLDKQEQGKPQASRWKEIITKRDKTKITPTQRINEAKSWFFKNRNNVNKPLANLTIMRREKIQINKIKDKKEERTTNANNI
jgi:hypothetical protein